VWDGEGGSLNETIENQLENQKDSSSWNPRGRFLVVLTESSNETGHLLAANLCSVLWQVARIFNVVDLIPNQFAYFPRHALNTIKISADGFNLYTWFPYKLGVCGEVQDVVPVDEWVFESNVSFLRDTNFYPVKVPKDLMGFLIKLGTVAVDPYVIMTENVTQKNGSTAYKVTGISVEIIKYVSEWLNLTYVFLPPSGNIEPDS